MPTSSSITIAVVGLALTFLMNFGGIVWGAARLSTTLLDLKNVVSRLSAAVDALDAAVATLDKRVAILEDRELR